MNRKTNKMIKSKSKIKMNSIKNNYRIKNQEII